jgi:superfamily II DNA helicase RecQ
MSLKKEDICRAYESLCKKYSLPQHLKKEQLKIMKKIINKCHTFGVLPTGYGKSLCFGLPPLILDEVLFL